MNSVSNNMKLPVLIFCFLLLPILSCSDSSEDYIASGLVKIKSRDYEGSLEDFSKAIELSPDKASAYINRGIVKRNLGDNEGAIQDYNKAIELDPNESRAYLNLAHLQFSMGDYPAAIKYYSKAIEVSQGEPNHTYAHYYYNRARARIKAQDYKGANLDYKTYMELITTEY